MARFDVFRHPEAKRRKTVPFLLSIQSDALDFLATRAVAPLVAENAFGPRIPFLHPVLDVDNQRVVLAINELVAVEATLLRGAVSNLGRDSTAIITALDYLISGY